MTADEWRAKEIDAWASAVMYRALRLSCVPDELRREVCTAIETRTQVALNPAPPLPEVGPDLQC